MTSAGTNANPVVFQDTACETLSRDAQLLRFSDRSKLTHHRPLIVPVIEEIPKGLDAALANNVRHWFTARQLERTFDFMNDVKVEEIQPVTYQKWTRHDIYELIRHINDPEHPLTLEQLHVVSPEHIYVRDRHVEDKLEFSYPLPHANEHSVVRVEFTPTIPHCSMATLIGLSIRVRLMRALPPRFYLDVLVRQGTHVSDAALNRQLNDRERVSAALENSQLIQVVHQCLATAIEAECK